MRYAIVSRPLRAIAVVLATLIPSLFLLPTSAAHAATEVYKYTFKGEYVFASTYSSGECVSSSTELSANATSVWYSSGTWNWCTQEGAYVYGEAAPTIFDIRHRSARLVATVPLSSGETLHVDNTWTAEGKAYRTRGSQTDQWPGQYQSVSRWSGTYQPSSVTGTVPFDDGFIATQAWRSISVWHG